MKPIVLASAILSAAFLVTAPAAAQPAPSRPAHFANRLLDDVVQMTRAGLSDDTIVAYVRSRRARLGADLSADDLIQLRRAGVSENVVRYIAGVTGVRVDEKELSAEVEAQPDEDVPYGDGSLYDGGYWGYPYPYWYAYSPYFFGGVIIRGGGFHRGFRHRSFHSGHFSGGHGHFSGGHGGGGHGHGGHR